MFSLCIPTMDRFDKFLKTYLEKYLKFNLIDEIIITDETGDDYNKITKEFNNTKIKCHVNDNRLGPFLNKINCCKKAKNDWIVLIDSDNFADEDYFINAKKFIETNNLNKFSILMPSEAFPHLNYKNLNTPISRNSSLNDIIDSKVCLNTGNYVLNKCIIEDINILNEASLIPKTHSCDVIFFNTLVLEQFANVKFYIVHDMKYNHEVHDGSIYLQTNYEFRDTNKYVHNRLYNLFENNIKLLTDERFYCKNKDTYPPFKNGLYLEEFFLEKFLKENPNLKKTYIPLLWTNFQIEQSFQSNKNELQTQLDIWTSNNPNPYGYFTIVQYDDGPLLKLPENTIVLGACSGHIPLPLIYEDKNETLNNIPKKNFSEKTILCSFVGSLTSNNIYPNVRETIYNYFKSNKKFNFEISNWTSNVNIDKQKSFINTTLNSKFVLAPRGYGRSSFRFWETLQLGSIPIYVYNDIEWLPYKDILDYSKFCISIHISQINDLEDILEKINQTQYESMLEEYNKIKLLFTLDYMYYYICNLVNIIDIQEISN